MAKKKSQQLTADDLLKQMYPDLLTSDDVAPAQIDTNVQQTQATAGTVDAKAFAELQAKLAELQGQVVATNRTNSALMTQAQTPLPPARPVVDFSKAPSPIDDPAGYAQFMYNANQMQIDYEKQVFNWQTQQQQSSAQKTSQLWSKFEQDYPAYAANDTRVEVAAQRVIARAKAMGQDTDKYMYGNSAGFMQDIVKEIDTLFGKPQATDDDGDSADDEGDDVRTNVFGGSVQTAAGASSKNAPPERYGVLSKDIMAWQQKTGFHR